MLSNWETCNFTIKKALIMDEANPVEQRMPRLTKLRIVKNLVLISSSFFLLFTAYDGLIMLQSTMNKSGGVGVISEASGFISFSVSSLLLPKFVITKLGCKPSLFVSILINIPFIAANFYPKWYILIPTAILAGMGASVLWGSQSTYFNESAVRFARLVEEESAPPDIPSNRTSIDFVSEKDFHHNIREDNALKDVLSKAGSSEETALKFRCKNPGCGNVDEFVVSEIAMNCVQYLKNEVYDTESPQAKEQNISNNIRCSENSKPKDNSYLQTIEPERPYNHQDPDAEQDDYGWRNKDYISKFDKGLVPENKNQQCQSIFRKANTLESVTSLFFGCHAIAYYSAQVCSNVLSYSILQGDDLPGLSIFFKCSCGAHFCNDNKWCINDDTEYVSSRIRYLLITICVGIACISALVIFLFLDPLQKENSDDEEEEFSCNLILATMSHNRKKEQMYLIPISFYEGLLQGFYAADFTKSYVGCAWGVSKVGLVSVFYGVACIVSSTASGVFVKYIGRKPLFLIGQMVSISMTIYLLLWKPDSRTPYKFYLAAIFFGTITGILWSQLLAFYGLLFQKDEEAAFSSYYLWSSLGWTSSFLLSTEMCTYVKIYFLLSASIIGTVGYMFTEKSYELRMKQGNEA